jgi:hypothetical protein
MKNILEIKGDYSSYLDTQAFFLAFIDILKYSLSLKMLVKIFNRVFAPFRHLSQQLFQLLKFKDFNDAVTAYLKEEVESTLTVTDNRTGWTYSIPIIRNTIPALSLKQIVVSKKGGSIESQYEHGLRVLDPGYRNTAIKLSNITYM